MLLVLVQHGAAFSEEEDPQRTLTAAGRAAVERMAGLLAESGLAPVREIRHSDKTRARQTAEILAEHLRPKAGTRQVAALAPMDDVKLLAEGLATEGEALMLVGHLPHLARLAGLLLAGDPGREVVRFQQAGAVGLVRTEGGTGWSLLWAIPPDLVSS